jgi:hypothetical protein
MMCDLVAIGTRAWQAEASKAERALSTLGLLVSTAAAHTTPLSPNGNTL